MQQFDFYEFAGIVTPGAIVLFGLSLIFPSWGIPITNKDMGIGDLGLFTILSYAAGHLVQVIGDFLELNLWRLKGGMPTYWLLLEDKYERLMGADQRTRVLKHCQTFDLLKLDKNDKPIFVGENQLKVDEKAWFAEVRELYTIVAEAGHNQRVDAFNRTVGLLRGLLAAFLVLAAVLAFKKYFHPGSQVDHFRLKEALLIVLALASLNRMYAFSVIYARELYVQFLKVPISTHHKSKPAVTPTA